MGKGGGGEGENVDNDVCKSHESTEETRKNTKNQLLLKQEESAKNKAGSQRFFGQLNRWITAKEASEYLGVSVGQIRNMVWRGQLLSYRLNNRLRFLKADLDKIVKPSDNWRKL